MAALAEFQGYFPYGCSIFQTLFDLQTFCISEVFVFGHDILLFSIFAQDTVGNDVIYILHGNRRLGHTKRNGSPMGEIISSTYVVDQHL